jgi:2-polyprenyl-3-methyl-5-hydroxy-6-metoxy-1,4-benzoquinol methylase
MNPDSASANASKCAVCGSSSWREVFTARDRLHPATAPFPIAQCAGCGVLRTLPEMPDSELVAFYPNDYWGEEEAKPEWIRSSQAEKTDFLRACELLSGTILDVGCGAGLFLRALDAPKWQRYGVETGAPAAQVAARHLGSDRVICGTLLQAAYPQALFDVVTFWSVLEHTSDPRAQLEEARRILKPRGTVILQLPNAGSYQTRWFGGDWFSLDAPRHRYHFNREALGRLLTETGFSIYREDRFSKTHNAHALRQSLKTHLRATESAAGRALFLAAIPWIKPLDWVQSSRGRGATLTIAARRD